MFYQLFNKLLVKLFLIRPHHLQRQIWRHRFTFVSFLLFLFCLHHLTGSMRGKKKLRRECAKTFFKCKNDDEEFRKRSWAAADYRFWVPTTLQRLTVATLKTFFFSCIISILWSLMMHEKFEIIRNDSSDRFQSISTDSCCRGIRMPNVLAYTKKVMLGGCWLCWCKMLFCICSNLLLSSCAVFMCAHKSIRTMKSW